MEKLFSKIQPDVRAEDTQQHPVFSLLQQFFNRFDWFQVIPMLLLLAIGALFIYGTGKQVGGVYAAELWQKQMLFMGLGLTFWFILVFFDYRWLIPGAFVIYPLSLLLLILVLAFGTEIFGAKRWLSIGGFSYQPSELAKLGVILSVSFLLSRKKADINKPLWALGVLVLTVIPFILIYKEPDLGTALVLLPIVGALIFAAHLKLRWILILLALMLAAAPVLYMNLKPYQKERIYTFLNPESDPTNLGWNAVQANLAVGRGGVTGKGFMEGTHCSLGYLPKTVANSDFIFPVIAEETGFIGAFLLLALYAVLMFSILRTAMLTPDDFGRYLCVGIAALLLTHVTVNIGMCIQLLPITGLPLPLVSYGGSFMVSMLIYLGIVQSVYAHRKQDNFLSD